MAIFNKTEKRSEFIDSLPAEMLETVAKAHDVTRAAPVDVKVRVRLAMLAGHKAMPDLTPHQVAMKLAAEVAKVGTAMGASPSEVCRSLVQVTSICLSDIANADAGLPLL